MSKAFTRESDDAPEEAISARPSSSLPPGAKNYITPDGAERLRAELHRLATEERPRLTREAEATDDSKRQLQRLNQRIQHIEESLQSAVVTPPPDSPEQRRQVRFGATVTVRRRKEEVCYRIVGVDEADPERGWVSWPSPIARALIGSSAGESVAFKFPSGEERLQIVAISYDSAETTSG